MPMAKERFDCSAVHLMVFLSYMLVNNHDKSEVIILLLLKTATINVNKFISM